MAFKYGPLARNEIRLLEIDRDNVSKHGPLSFKARSYHTDALPPYIAVSYQWGEGVPNRLIYLDGNEFWIRDNLWWCLHNLRKRESWQFLWVDFICINQQDLAERNVQVQLMGQIYTNAFSVVAWVGLECDYREDYLDEEELVFGAGGLQNKVWEGIEELARRSYWSRMWVVQEILLARRILIFCGGCCIPWKEFENLYSSANHSDAEDSMVLPFIETRNKRKEDRELPLHELLVRYRRSQCKDLRDRVFSVLSLLGQEERKVLSRFFPNYSLSVEDVLIITMAHLRRTAHLSFDAFLLDIFEFRDPRTRKRLCKTASEMDLTWDAKPRIARAIRRSVPAWLTPWRHPTGVSKGVTSPESRNPSHMERHAPQSSADEEERNELERTDDVDEDPIVIEREEIQNSEDELIRAGGWESIEENPLTRSFVELKWHIRTIAGPQTRTEAFMMALHRLVPLYKLFWFTHRIRHQSRQTAMLLWHAVSPVLHISAKAAVLLRSIAVLLSSIAICLLELLWPRLRKAVLPLGIPRQGGMFRWLRWRWRLLRHRVLHGRLPRGHLLPGHLMPGQLLHGQLLRARSSAIDSGSAVIQFLYFFVYFLSQRSISLEHEF